MVDIDSIFITESDIFDLKSKARSRSKALSARPDPGACKSDNRPNQSEELFREFASNKSSAPSKTIKTIVSVPSKHFFDPNSAPKKQILIISHLFMRQRAQTCFLRSLLERWREFSQRTYIQLCNLRLIHPRALKSLLRCFCSLLHFKIKPTPLFLILFC